MALDLRLQHKMSQQLVMTPQLQQAIKLLALSHLELAEALRQEVAQNPLLEEIEPTSGRHRIDEGEAEAAADADASADGAPAPREVEFAEAASCADGPDGPSGWDAEGDAPSAVFGDDGAPPALGAADGEAIGPHDADGERDGHGDGEAFATDAPDAQAGDDPFWERAGGTGARGAAAGPDDDGPPSWERCPAEAAGLREHLAWQVQMGAYTPQEQALAGYFIAELNDDGYLAPEAVDAAAASFAVDPAVSLAVLRRLQACDPPGVAARSLSECLALQVVPGAPDAALQLALLQQHLPALAGRQFAKLARALKVDVGRVMAAARRIAALQPHPGRAFDASVPAYVVPDLFVQATGSSQPAYHVWANDEGLPQLGISPLYGPERCKDLPHPARAYVQDKLRAANWLLRSMHMRQRTMLKVMRSIVKFQRAFFDAGPTQLRPMVLRDVAQDIAMHESTISRVTSNKYVHTPHGTFELKYFFSSRVPQARGQSVASQSVRQTIERFINREDKHAPLSDQKIVDLLQDQDVRIARRTVAKYRKMLNKRPSNVRRRDF